MVLYLNWENLGLFVLKIETDISEHKVNSEELSFEMSQEGFLIIHNDSVIQIIKPEEREKYTFYEIKDEQAELSLENLEELNWSINFFMPWEHVNNSKFYLMQVK